MSTMSSSENIAFRTATLWASSGGTFASTSCSVARSRPSRSPASMNSGRRRVSSDTPSEKYETVAEMSRGGLRLRRNQRVARSTSLRHSRSILVCVWASTTLSRDSISSHRERMSNTSQAAVYALAISAGAAPLTETEGERGAASVYQVVHHAGGGDLASQPVLAHLLAEAFAQRRREVTLQLDCEVRVLGEVGVTQLFVERDLGVREQDGELGGGEADTLGPAFGQNLVAREELELAVEAACLLEGAYVE